MDVVLVCVCVCGVVEWGGGGEGGVVVEEGVFRPVVE